MKQKFQQLLELPGSLNQKIFKGLVNNELDNFDTQNGIRSYVKTIYTWAALVVFVSMEVGILKAAFAYFTDSADTMLAKVGSVFALLILMVAAFPIAQIIKSKGEQLSENHTGMVSFVFNDFVKTNIRMLGEITAIAGLVAAINLTLSFVLDTNLYSANPGNSLSNILMPLYSFPVEALNAVLNAAHLGAAANFIGSVTSYTMPTSTDFAGDFHWKLSDLHGVVGAYINVILGLVFMYINLAIYGYLYNLAATFINWVSSPSIPIAMKNKN